MERIAYIDGEKILRNLDNIGTDEEFYYCGSWYSYPELEDYLVYVIKDMKNCLEIIRILCHYDKPRRYQ